MYVLFKDLQETAVNDASTASNSEIRTAAIFVLLKK